MLQESILQYFRPSLSYHLSLRPLFWLFMSGRLRQVLLYNSKTCVNGHYQKDQKMAFKTDYRLMQVKSIAECSTGFTVPCLSGVKHWPVNEIWLHQQAAKAPTVTTKISSGHNNVDQDNIYLSTQNRCLLLYNLY